MLQKKIKTKIFIVCLILFVLNIGVYGNEKLDITHGPYLIDQCEDAITIVWFTNNPSSSWVEYSGDKNFGTFPTWGGYPKIAKNSNHGLIDANTTKHVIRLENLSPGAIYKYRVNSREIRQFNPYEVLYGDTFASEVYSFETLNPQRSEFSFCVVADIHERASVLDTLLEIGDTEKMDMIFYTGDMLNWIGDENRIFDGMIDVSVKHFAKNKPFVYVRGNHETRGAKARKLFEYFPHHSNEFYYAFKQGETYFIILDVGEDKPDSHPVYAGLVDFDNYRDVQTEWLKKEVESDAFKNAKYKVVVNHIPLFTNSKGHGGEDATKKWGQILNKAKIDLMISGHHHQYAFIQKNKNGNKFPILVLGTDMILNADVNKNNMNLEMKNIDNSIEENITIKPKWKK